MAKALRAADHERSAARTGGTEWFLTSLRFLDVVAEALSLPATVRSSWDVLAPRQLRARTAAPWTRVTIRWCDPTSAPGEVERLPCCHADRADPR